MFASNRRLAPAADGSDDGIRSHRSRSVPRAGEAGTSRAFELFLLATGLLLVSLALGGWDGTIAQVDGLELTALPRGVRPNVVLISIDTLRADRLGSYGYEHPTSHNLDALAEEGVRFQNAASHAPWTIPSHMSLFTSRLPSEHGVDRGYFEYAEHEEKGRFRPLRPGVPTLAESLQRAGYRTLALVGGGTVLPGYGFEHGFDEFAVGSAKISEENWSQIQEWLGTGTVDPFFLFLHTFEVHAPYSRASLATDDLDADLRRRMSEALLSAPPGGKIVAQERFLRDEGLFRREITSALYDSGIARVDAFVGRLLDDLRYRGLLDRTLFVVTSDHGEEFGDHDPNRFFDSHCSPQYQELLHVPLLMRLPGAQLAGQVVRQPVGLIDLAPTILDLVDVAAPVEFRGRSLAPLLAGGLLPPASVLSEATCVGNEIKALRFGRQKLIATYELPASGDRSGLPGRLLRTELYDLLRDPGEREDLSVQRSDQAERLRRQLRARIGRLTAHDATGSAVSGVPDSRRAHTGAVPYL